MPGMPRYRRPRRRAPIPIFIMLPLAAFTAALLWNGAPPGFAVSAPRPTPADPETARFAACAGPVRVNCVVDGDTFLYRGAKIRIADINTPETSEPQCAREAELGARATARLAELLSAGPFSLEPIDRDRDRYGRVLRVVTRGGTSLGATLEREGLAEHWHGRRGDWC
jgi:micrococcal nuclease